MKDELSGKIMTEFPNTYSYLTEDNEKDEKRHKKVCHKKKT